MSRAHRSGLVHGRFQPFHVGHAHLVDTALELADRVVVLIGNTDIRDDRHPWSYYDRRRMVVGTFPQEVADGRLIVAATRSLPPSAPLHAWGEMMYRAASDFGERPTVVVAGPEYDASRWATSPPLTVVRAPERIAGASGTAIRAALAASATDVPVPPATARVLGL